MAALISRHYLFTMTLVLRSERLDLTPFTPDILDAMIRGDTDRLCTLAGADFRAGVAPPLMEDALPHFLDRLRGGDAPEWWGWLAVDRSLEEVVGAVGFAGKPENGTTVLLGYSVYKRYERMGYGTEAAGTLIDWAFQQPGITAVRATIPPWNTPSIRVAEKLGMQVSGEAEDPEAGRVIVYEKRKPGPAR